MADGNAHELDPGKELAVGLVQNLAEANRNLEIGRKISMELGEQVDTLVGYFEVFSRAMELLDEQRGKKLSLADFSRAWVDAEGEVFGDDDDDEGGEAVPVEPTPVGDGHFRRR